MTTTTRPPLPERLNHVAYIAKNTSETVEFYTKILGMELVAAVVDDRIPSTGDPVPYFHSFFKMADGSTLAFFEAPELPEPAELTHPAYNIFQHLALEVGSTTNVDAWAEWLKSNNVDVVGPVNHGIIYSVYFYDPSGIRLELTTPLDPSWNDHAEGAAESLRDWESVKAEARSTGQDVAVVLAEFTRQRSHRKANDLPPAGTNDPSRAGASAQ